MPFDATPKRLGFAGVCLAAASFLAPADAFSQQTVIIGGGPSAQPLSRAPAPSTVGSGAGGIVVNNSVLDSLGPGATGGLPLAAPQTPVYGAGIAAPGASVTPGGATGAYRAPGTGQLMVTRPATLLYPPMQTPTSRLAVAPARRAAAPIPVQTGRSEPAASSGGKLTSRLIAAPPKKRPAAMAAPKLAAKPPKAAPAAKAPASTAAKTAIVPAKPAIPAPPPPSLLARIQKDTEAQTSAKTPPAAKAATAPPKPVAPALPPKVQAPAAPKAPSVPAPKLAAPKVTAPAVPAPKPAETALASLPPAKNQAAALPSGDLRLAFTAGSAELSDAAKKHLAGLAQNLEQQPSKRVQLLAFAAGSGGGASKARRLSLSRALAVRAFLIDKGVRSTRMDVRALGSKTGDGPADRVDILTQ